jgi:hypothetical protein
MNIYIIIPYELFIRIPNLMTEGGLRSPARELRISRKGGYHGTIYCDVKRHDSVQICMGIVTWVFRGGLEGAF